MSEPSPAEEALAAGPPEDPEHQPPRLKPLRRGLGVPWLFAAVYSSVGFSIYFALGVVADRGLGLTPFIFLAAGLLFVLTTLTYVEGGSMFRERGGSSTFARYAFNEFVSFIAGWAILIDYLIVIALAAISVPHYLEPISGDLAEPGFEVAISALVILGACFVNIRDLTGANRQRSLAALALADLLLQLAVIVVGLIAVWHPDRLTNHLDLFTNPSFVDIVYAAVLAMLAYSGIEAAANLAPDIDFDKANRPGPRDLRRVVTVGAIAVPLVYAGMAFVALMAVPVISGPHGPHTGLGSQFVEAPVLGVVSAYDPAWLADMMRWVVMAIAVPVLIWAANTAMLGLSRHVYTLAVNRQIPSWLGRLNSRWSTPHVAIGIFGLIAIGLVVPTDVKLLAGIYAFGATLALTIAHLSIIRLRRLAPDMERPFRIPLSFGFRGTSVPLPAVVAALFSGLAFISVLIYHDRARWVGGGWMLFGIVGYVIYRRLVEGTTLTRRVSVTPESLTKQVHELQFRRILVPVFGTELDDDIVGTAGRLAAPDPDRDGPEEGACLEVIYVVKVPLTLPLDARLAPGKEEEADRVLKRAQEVGEEYEDVEVKTRIVRAREVGAGIVQAARESSPEAIVMGGEPPSKIRGGAVLGGIGAARPAEVGPSTEYVLKKAPVRVLLTAPPERPAESSDGGQDSSSGASLVSGR